MWRRLPSDARWGQLRPFASEVCGRSWNGPVEDPHLRDLRRRRDNRAVGKRSDDELTRSWWQTLPGMLTAAAGLISAITGLVVAVQQLRGDDHSSDASPSAVQATASTTGSGSAEPSGGVITSPAGAATAARVGFPSGRSVRIGEATYQVLTARAGAANPGELMLALRVRMTNDGPYAANFWNRTFRLRIGADTSAPTNFLDELVEAGTTETGEVDFSVPGAARRATLLVGDDPSKAIALPLRLTPRH